MLVEGDLGLSRLVLLVFLFVPVIGLVARRKWRLMVARREEIQKLLVMASEEAARAELESFSGYVNSEVVIPQQLQNQCTVCFSPTTTRCARCKVVRYCSGKCQIVHWRQGHKDDCRPFIITNEINDVGGGFVQKVNYQREDDSHVSRYGSHGSQCAESVEKVSEEPASSDSIRCPDILNREDDNSIAVAIDGKDAYSASKVTTSPSCKGFPANGASSEHFLDLAVCDFSHSEIIDLQHSTNIEPDKLETVCDNNLDNIGTPSAENPSFNSSSKLSIRTDCSDGDTNCGSTSSPGWSVDDSNGSSSSEPSTPSSGFWEETIDSSRSKCEALDDSAHSNSGGVANGNVSFSQSSINFSSNSTRDAVTSLLVQGPDAKKIKLDNAHPFSKEIKMPNDPATYSEGKSKDSPASCSSEISSHVENEPGDEPRDSKNREDKNLSGVACSSPLPSSISVHSRSINTSNIRNLPSLDTERLNHMVHGVTRASSVLKSREIESLSSKPSNMHISSSIGNRSVSCAMSKKVDNGREVAASNNVKASVRKVVDHLISSKLSRHYPSGFAGESTERYNHKGLFSYEQFVKLYNSKKVDLRPCGLRNCGNSCYANAVLQCLAFTPALTAYLLEGFHSKACGKKGWCFTCEFESLVLKVKGGNSPLSPVGILSQIQNIGSRLGNGKEEDAHEFLRYAIDTMQSVCLKETGSNASGSPEEETTLIGLTFGGYLLSKIKCIKCGGKSERREKMMDLTVEIDGDIKTLEEALQRFTTTEILDGENKYQCSRCKTYEKAQKRLTVLEAPNVLTIALKRFQSGKFGKLNKMVQFPDQLDLTPYMTGTSDKSPIYRLYGVVVHLDVMNASFSGHYVCYVKNIQNKWFKIDDSVVKNVEIERVLTKGAYMLLYARCSPRAPRLIRDSLATHDPRKLTPPTIRSRSQTPAPRNSPLPDPSNVQANPKPFDTDHTSLMRNRTFFEDDSSSDNSSSLSFSEEGGSSSTESTRVSSVDDFFVLDDLGQNRNSRWRNSSDSDTSSSSSSSPSPPPLHLKHSPLADLDRYASKYSETRGSHIDHGLRDRRMSRSSKAANPKEEASFPSMYYEKTEQCRKLGGSSLSYSSCREIDSDGLGRANPNGVKLDATIKISTR